MHRQMLKAIIHLDMDAFYPSVEMLDKPELKGKPVIVGGSTERGVVSSASYEARKFGVHSAQPIALAKRMCPDGIFLPVRMWRYKEISQQIVHIFFTFTPLVEPISIDEAFLDITGSQRLFGRPEDIAKEIKQRVFAETGLTVSAGLAPSKFVAKIASDIDKPDGFTMVTNEKVRDFLNPLSVTKMWGVGSATQKVLSQLNIYTFEELSLVPVKILEDTFGKHGIKMHLLSMGVDDREVVPEFDAKSIGHEDTFARDIVDIDRLKTELLSQANKVAYRMRREGVTGRTITLKVKYKNFVQATRSITIGKPTDDGLEIYNTACSLLKNTEAGKRPIRLLGISLSKLSLSDSSNQLSLFNNDDLYQKKKKLNTALDSLYKKHGETSIRLGTLLHK
jgi:DNA polymerase IV